MSIITVVAGAFVLIAALMAMSADKRRYQLVPVRIKRRPFDR